MDRLLFNKRHTVCAIFYSGNVKCWIIHYNRFTHALGKLPSAPLTEWSTEFGFVALIIFSSLGLMDRIMNLNDELTIYKLKVDQKNEELEASNEELHAALEELEATNGREECSVCAMMWLRPMKAAALCTHLWNFTVNMLELMFPSKLRNSVTPPCPDSKFRADRMPA